MLSQQQVVQLRTSAGLSPTAPSQNASSIIAQRKAALGAPTPTPSNPLMDITKSIVSPVATMAARPFQAAADVGDYLGTQMAMSGKTQSEKDAILAADQARQQEKQTTPSMGGLVAPTPANYSDVGKDVGRAAETVALGLGPVAGGAAFMGGNAAENGGSATDIALNTALGAAGGKVLQLVGTPIFNAAGKVIGKITPQYIQDVVSQGAGAIKDFAAAHNILPEPVSNAINIGAEKLNQAAETPFNAAGSLIRSTGEALRSGIGDKALAQEKAAWAKPTYTPKPAYNKATGIYNSTSEAHIPDTLVNNGVHISDNVENINGKQVYSTADTAEKIRTDAAKMSHDVLRPSLAKADATGAPKITIDDLFSKAESNVKNGKYPTPGAKETVLANIAREKAAMAKTYPNGLSLVDLHDNRIVYDNGAKYSPIGDVATNNIATANKAIADAARATLENSTPKDIPVREFNAELGKQFQAADYLDALHGKPVPKSLISIIARTGAKVVGAGLGAVMPGAGILTEVGGYHLGGIVESSLEGLPAAARNKLLANLEVSNPEVFQKVEAYLNSRATSGSVTHPMSSASKNMPISSNPTAETTEMSMGTYKMGRSKTGRSVPVNYRPSGANFYPSLKNSAPKIKDFPKYTPKMINEMNDPNAGSNGLYSTR